MKMFWGIILIGVFVGLLFQPEQTGKVWHEKYNQFMIGWNSVKQ